MRRISTAIWIALATLPGLIALVATAPVSAQKFKSISDEKAKEPEKKKPDDGQYKSAIERLPDKKFDPWANMR